MTCLLLREGVLPLSHGRAEVRVKSALSSLLPSLFPPSYQCHYAQRFNLVGVRISIVYPALSLSLSPYVDVRLRGPQNKRGGLCSKREGGPAGHLPQRLRFRGVVPRARPLHRV